MTDNRLTVGYARVSTDAQGYSIALDNQIQRLWDSGVDRVFADIASRSVNDRKGLQSLIDLINQNLVKVVVITRLDRLTSNATLFESFVEALKSNNCRLEGIDEDLDVSEIDGEFIGSFKTLLSRREILIASKRSRYAVEAKKRNNRANFKAPFGYVVIDRQYQLDNSPSTIPGLTNAELARKFIDKFFEYGSINSAFKAIQDEYGFTHVRKPRSRAQRSFVLEDPNSKLDLNRKPEGFKVGFADYTSYRKWLDNPVLRGHTAYGLYSGIYEIRYDTHPDRALLTEEEYEIILDTVKQNKRAHKWGSHIRYALTGIMKCSECDCRFVMRNGTGDRRYYCCPNKNSHKRETKSIRADRAELAICEKLIEVAENIDDWVNTEEGAISADPELNLLKQQLQQLLPMASNPAIQNAISDVQRQIDDKKREIRRRHHRQESTGKSLIKALKDLRFWQGLSNDHKVTIFNDLLDYAVIYNGEITEIKLKF